MNWWNWLRNESASIGNDGQSIDPPILAFCWEGGESSGHAVQEINANGARICTPDRWHVGTILSMIVQQKEVSGDALHSVQALAKIVRHASEGIEVEFVFSSRKQRESVERFVEQAALRASARLTSIPRDWNVSETAV